jgi:NAD(P)-dependent dehydrogenase (short-subunit alcohol dehydrogenase family)
MTELLTGNLSGRVAVVTGGAQGIGLGIVETLASRGARVGILDIRADAARTAAEIVAQRGLEVRGEGADVADRHSVEQAIDAIEAEWGCVDLLVNNAGVSLLTSFIDADDETWSRSVATNLTGSFIVSQICARKMIAAGRAGAIVNIASIAAFNYTAEHPIYAATKAGLVALTRDLAYELGVHQIRVNAVAPGPIRSPLTDEHGWGTRFDRALRLGRWGTPHDIGRAVAFLASEEASFVTGQTLNVAGGADLRTLDPR